MEKNKQHETIIWLEKEGIDHDSLEALVLCFLIGIQDPSQFEIQKFADFIQKLKDDQSNSSLG
jgi:hypothetical protein